jgi:hypothetical protein
MPTKKRVRVAKYCVTCGRALEARKVDSFDAYTGKQNTLMMCPSDCVGLGTWRILTCEHNYSFWTGRCRKCGHSRFWRW